jgi:MFS family permease
MRIAPNSGAASAALPKENRARAIAIMALPLGLSFILSMFLRSAAAVIAPDIRAELALGPTELGALTAALFLGSAAMQLPAGLMLDRLGPRRTIALCQLVGAVGAASMLVVSDVWGLALAWFAMGVGVAPIYMGMIVLFSRWVPRDRLAQASAISVATGGMGFLLSSAPFAAASVWLGWRLALASIGGLALLFSILVYALVRDRPRDMPPPDGPPESLLDVLRGLVSVMRDRRVYLLAAMASLSFSTIMAVRSLWVGPFLADVYGLDIGALADIVLLMSIGWVASALIYGPLDRRFDTRRGVVTCGAVAMTVALLGLAATGDRSLGFATAFLVMLALAASFSAVIFAQARALFPDRLVGRVISTINLFIWGSVSVVQLITGAILDLFPTDAAGSSPPAAYQAIFAVLAAMVVASLVAYRRVEDVPPSEEMARHAAAERTG